MTEASFTSIFKSWAIVHTSSLVSAHINQKRAINHAARHIFAAAVCMLLPAVPPHLYVVFYKYQCHKRLNNALLFLNWTSRVCFGAERRWITAGKWRASEDEEWAECYSVTDSVLLFDPSLSSRIQFGWTSSAICPPSLSQQSWSYCVRFVSWMESKQFRRGAGWLLAGGVGEIVGKLFCRWNGKMAASKKTYQEVTSPTWNTLLLALWLIADFLSLSLSLRPLHRLSPQQESSQLQLQTLSHYANDFPTEKLHACCPSIQQGLQFEYAGIFFSLSALLFSIFVKRMFYFWCIAMLFPSPRGWGEPLLNQFLQTPLEYMLLSVIRREIYKFVRNSVTLACKQKFCILLLDIIASPDAQITPGLKKKLLNFSEALGVGGLRTAPLFNPENDSWKETYKNIRWR